jgi:transcriptional regulator with XRE-family HTH domain
MAKGLLLDGETIQRLRNERGLTQVKLGLEIMGKGKTISPRTVQRIETDNSYKCSEIMIKKFADFFGVPNETLISVKNFHSEEKLKNDADDIDDDYQEEFNVDLAEPKRKAERKSTLRERVEEDSAYNDYLSEEESKREELQRQYLEDLELEQKKLEEKLEKDLLSNSIDETREFLIDEEFLRILVKEAGENHKTELEEKVIDDMRNYKFIPTNFSNLVLGTSKQLSYKLLLKTETRLKIRRVWDDYHIDHEYEKNYDSYRWSGNERFFKGLFSAQYYSIDSDVPEDKETLEIVCEVIDNIENYLILKKSLSDKVRFKFNMSSLIKKLESKKISIFSKIWNTGKQGFDKNFQQTTITENHFRILIKNWKNPSVITWNYCEDSEESKSSSNYVQVQWRNHEENNHHDDVLNEYFTFVEKAKRIHRNKYDYTNSKYIDHRTKIRIECKKHGDFEQLPTLHLRGRGCPRCSQIIERRNIESKLLTFIEKAQLIHGNRYDYSNSKYINQRSKIIDQRTKIRIVCKKHGVFSQLPEKHLTGQGCPRCSQNIERSNLNSKLLTFIEKANQVHGKKYDYSNSKYINPRIKVKISCNKHGVFSQLPEKHLSGGGCPECSNK